MTDKPRRPIEGTSDLRGVARLATDATLGLADLVEAMHERIARLPGVTAPDAVAMAGRTRGITGLVYRSVRGVTRVAGGNVDALLSVLAPLFGGGLAAGDVQALPRPQREALLAALNGVLGDHLAQSGNPLAIPMTLRRDGRSLSLDRSALEAALMAEPEPALPNPGSRSALLVVLHGLCMNDLQTARAGNSHAAALAQALGMTPLHLHYNSGLPVAANGRSLSLLLEQLLTEWPHPVQRLTLLGHSMGGLVARSAVAQAQAAGDRWPERLANLVFLGTPHHGAPLERAGHGLSMLLAATPYTAPLVRLVRLRSAGITDLRHGRFLNPEPDADAPPRPPPLPDGVRCFAVAGCLGADPADLKARLLGDGLVPVDSAFGRHADPARTLQFPEDRLWLAQGVGHVDLLHSDAVRQQLLRWLRAPVQRALG